MALPLRPTMALTRVGAGALSWAQPERATKAFGLTVAWIERVTPEAMALACVDSDLLPPLTMFKALRTQMDELELEPDYRIHTLSELPAIVARP